MLRTPFFLSLNSNLGTNTFYFSVTNDSENVKSLQIDNLIAGERYFLYMHNLSNRQFEFPALTGCTIEKRFDENYKDLNSYACAIIITTGTSIIITKDDVEKLRAIHRVFIGKI